MTGVQTCALPILEGAECLAMVKVLYTLGYGGGMDLSIYSGTAFEEKSLLEVVANKNEIVKEINKSLKITGF